MILDKICNFFDKSESKKYFKGSDLFFFVTAITCIYYPFGDQYRLSQLKPNCFGHIR